MTKNLDALNAITDVVMSYRPKEGKRKGSGKKTIRESMYTFWEFFAGGGMVRAGLGSGWKCLFANDFDFKKSKTYRDNWDGNAFVRKDVAKVATSEIPGTASLVWASFPCQDLSLAGMGAGLRGDRSGTFWPFWRLVKKLSDEDRAPRMIALENVCGTITSNGGKDFVAIADALAKAGYRFGAVVIDGAEFVPQSRRRLFIIAASEDTAIPSGLISESPTPRHNAALRSAHSNLRGKSAESWIWWNIPTAPARTTRFVDLIEDEPESVEWHSKKETQRLLKMMSPINREKVRNAKKSGEFHVGAIYKRTREDENGNKVQRAEIRFDDLSGCLRTSTGGSSRQVILTVHGDDIRSRLLSSREAARLMGLPDSYRLPERYNEAYHLAGDGVIVPVVRHLAEHVFEPVLNAVVARVSATA